MGNERIITVDNLKDFYSKLPAKTKPALTQGCIIDDIIDTNVHAIVKLTNDDLIIGTDAGIKYSSDRGITWQASNMCIRAYKVFAVLSDNTIITNIHDRVNSIQYSTDKGKTWINSEPVTGEYNKFAVLPDDTILAGYTKGACGIKYSTDKGVTWNSSNITNEMCYYFIVLDTDNVIASTDTGIKYSTDKGVTWNDSNITDNIISHIILSDGTVLIGTGSRYIYYSTDKGATWAEASAKYTVHSFCVANNNNVISVTDTGIIYSTDKGITWTETANTQNMTTQKVLSNGIILAGGALTGIKYSEDNGVTWQDSNITDTRYNVFFELQDGTVVAASSKASVGIIYSFNAGVTWYNTNIVSKTYDAIIDVDTDTFLVVSSENGGIKRGKAYKNPSFNTSLTDGNKLVTRNMLTDVANDILQYILPFCGNLAFSCQYSISQNKLINIPDEYTVKLAQLPTNSSYAWYYYVYDDNENEIPFYVNYEGKNGEYYDGSSIQPSFTLGKIYKIKLYTAKEMLGTVTAVE